MNMTKQEYLQGKEYLKRGREDLVKFEAELRKNYIESNKPFDIGVFVEIVTAGNRTIKGEVKDFSIGKESTVFVSTIKPDGKPNIYISVLYKSIKQL